MDIPVKFTGRDCSIMREISFFEENEVITIDQVRVEGHDHEKAVEDRQNDHRQQGGKALALRDELGEARVFADACVDRTLV